ncbi:heterokaryon incompatibility protein-domain-containing protein [Cadophora sp. MPI-SDFR-AT-0126]|nr:heterokaryon incompatibility protein-domain-containing protein [Leotiomycetes sp. MPI-SDFR-AT-0126]
MAFVRDIQVPEVNQLSDGTAAFFREAFEKNGINVPNGAEFDEHILAMFHLYSLRRNRMGHTGDFDDSPLILDDIDHLGCIPQQTRALNSSSSASRQSPPIFSVQNFASFALILRSSIFSQSEPKPNESSNTERCGSLVASNKRKRKRASIAASAVRSELQIPESLPVIRLSTVPQQGSTCEFCKSGQQVFGQNMSLLRDSVKSGCSDCSLRYLGVLKALGLDDARARGTAAYVQFKGPVTSIILLKEKVRKEDNLEILLYTQFGQPRCSWPIVGAGRELARCRRSTYLSVVSEWLRSCHEDHDDCPKGDTPLPTRVLEVGDIGSDWCRLRISDGRVSSYAALSHCWGGAVSARTTGENLKDRQSSISFDELPKTFQDAVTVTRDLGLHYLWIDALCIVQDDQSDWEQESGKMTDVYQNAYVVIGADMSVDSNGGFLDLLRERDRKSGAPVAFIADEGVTVHARADIFHRNPCPFFNNGRWVGQPLARRAWTLQEQILATRMIHFTDDELVWDCCTGLRCECMELDHGYSEGQNQRIAYNNCLASSDADKFTVWSRVVDSIAVRDLTFKADLLPSLSGLAKQMQDGGAGTYLAGLWLDDLPHGLLWSTETSIHKRVSPYRAPSWSWASVEMNKGPYKRRHIYGQRKLGKVYAQVLEAHCTPSGKDPLGTVSDGHVSISAPLLEVGCKRSFQHEFFWLVHLDPEITDPIFPSLDFDLRLDRNETLHCLFIGEAKFESGTSECCGLILQRKYGASMGVFERVGSFRERFELAGDFLKSSKVTTIVIV